MNPWDNFNFDDFGESEILEEDNYQKLQYSDGENSPRLFPLAEEKTGCSAPPTVDRTLKPERRTRESEGSLSGGVSPPPMVPERVGKPLK